jgi:hypothetical protein
MFNNGRKTIHTIVVSVGGRRGVTPVIAPVARKFSKGSDIRIEELDGHSLRQKIIDSDQVYIQAELALDFQQRYGDHPKFHAFASTQILRACY